jgi:putative membrane protein
MGPEAFSWQPHPDAWLLTIALLGGYFYALSAWGPRYAAGEAATGRHRLYFVLGVAAIWVATDWPLDLLAGQLFSVHMVQHLIYAFIAAPLLILGTPGWLLRRLLAPRPIRALWGFATRPLVALIFFNAWTAGYHWPWLVDLSVSNELVHFAVHIVWVVAGLVMWWPVLSPLPELPHLAYPIRMAYLFGASIVPTLPASFLTYGNVHFFETYAATAPLWGLDPIVDQQIGGLIMKVGGGFLLWGVILALFFRWHHEEETGGPDILYWRDIASAVQAPTESGRLDDETTGGHTQP